MLSIGRPELICAVVPSHRNETLTSGDEADSCLWF